MPLTPGHVLRDRYRIDRLIAKGGMGAVYAAHDLNLGIPCALKENGLVTEEAMRQFEREARLLATLRHSNLPTVTDHFVLPDQGQYLVMSYIEGEDLVQRLKRLGQASQEEVERWALDVLHALAYLHQRNIVHRDIKPANVKITPEGSAVLVDFGIAKELDAIDITTTTGARRLTPGFAPPEQYGAGTGRTDPRSDIYALGATLYTLLTGVLPADALTRLMDPEAYIPLSRPGLTLKPALAHAIDRALALDPKKRFANAQEMLAGLHTAPQKSTQPAPAALPASLVPATGRAPVPVLSATDTLGTAVVPMGSGLLGTNVIDAEVKEMQAVVTQPDVVEEKRRRRGVVWFWMAALLVLFLLFWWGWSLLPGAAAPARSTETPSATATGRVGESTGTLAVDVTPTQPPGSVVSSSTQRTPPVTVTAGPTSLAGAVTQTALAFQGTSQSIAATQTAQTQLTRPGASTSVGGPLPSNTPGIGIQLNATSTGIPPAAPTATPPPTATAAPTSAPRPGISLNPPGAAVGVGGATQMTVSITAAQSGDVVVSLNSSNPGAVSVPGTVVIPSGGTSASFSAGGQSAGSATITASLPGSLGGASGSASITVNKVDTSTSLSASPNPATVGQQVTVSFTVSGGGAPAGTVTIVDEGGTICTASAPSGSCSFIPGTTGTRSLTASYSGDSNYNASTSPPLSLPVSALSITLAPPDSCTVLSAITLTVTLGAAQAGDTGVSLSSSNGLITVPSSVTVPAGSQTAQFAVNGAVGQATITASLPAPLGGASAGAHVRFALPLVGC